jgi:hypothetical protein
MPVYCDLCVYLNDGGHTVFGLDWAVQKSS